ncbi:MAG TPA: NIPSNAP family protein, partial [Opitutaceae bacterium]|nr:NIPSNAP family protein [Opitutaceae bacterium]
MKTLRLFLLASFLASAAARAGDAPPVYQLRVYTAAEGKMPALLERFRDHTCALFEKHGIALVGAWTPANPAKDGNKLYYVVSFQSVEAGEAASAAFGADPEWIKVKSESEARAGGPLVARGELTYLA